LDLVVVGSVAFDSIDTPHGSVHRAIGGSATYFSLAANLFSRVGVVGVVGGDFGDENMELLRSKGIDLSGLEVRKDEKTFFWHGSYMDDMNDRTSITTELNVFSSFSPKLPGEYRKAGFLFLANIDPDIQLGVLEQMETGAVVGLDTMNFWIEGKPDELGAVMKKVDILFINDSEALMLSGENNLVKAGKVLLGMGPGRVIVKKGANGAMMFAEDSFFMLPAFPLENVVDPTGAGDSFAGAFMGYIASSGDLDELTFKRALLYATVVASFTCEGFSIERLASLERKEVEERKEGFISSFSIS